MRLFMLRNIVPHLTKFYYGQFETSNTLNISIHPTRQRNGSLFIYITAKMQVLLQRWQVILRLYERLHLCLQAKEAIQTLLQ
jgi:hypothetical protein